MEGGGKRYKSAVRGTVRRAAGIMSRALPLSARHSLATWAGRKTWPGACELSIGLLDHLRHQDPNALHRFLWSNHLAYARSYEVRQRFGASRINPSRHILFDRISHHVRSQGLDPRRDIQSVFEVGC